MSVQRLGIQEYLQQKDVQQRIQQHIEQAHLNVTVSISRAATLFGFSENKLREWERKGLLISERGAISQSEKGHRQYTTNELSKLAVLQELFQQGKYTPGDIPPNFDAMWKQIEREQQNHILAPSIHLASTDAMSRTQADKKHIDHRVEYAEQEIFWRYFTSQALRLSLMLICEDIPDSIAALILPLRPEAKFIGDPAELPGLDEALIGWLNLNGSFDTFLETNPSFEHPSDFRIEPLPAVGKGLSPIDKTMIVVQRKMWSLNLSLELVQTVRSLLQPVYKNVEHCRSAFNSGMRDYLYQATNFYSTTDPSDDVLNKLMDMVIQLGGKSVERPEQDRWRFCCLLLPQDDSLPMQKRSLIVRAQSEHSPYKVHVSSVTLENPGLSLRAHQSGNIIYRPDMSAKDLIVAYQELEASDRSTIAIPVKGDDGLSIAVLYIASDEAHAFSEQDQRLLRLIGTMVEELLLTYRARQQVTGKRTDLIDHSGIVDPSFKPFLTENDFISDVEELLTTIQSNKSSKHKPEAEVSFIAIDIDNQSALATKYGNRVARNLSREVGLRLQGLLNLFTNSKHQRLYHINADRYYLLLEDMPLDEACKRADQLRIALEGDYLIDMRQTTSEGSPLPENMLKLSDITVRLGVPTYKFWKLKEILGRFAYETAVFEVRTVITKALDQVLKQGSRDGGNVIISWDHEKWGYVKWAQNQDG